jgi:hypothetical protein
MGTIREARAGEEKAKHPRLEVRARGPGTSAHLTPRARAADRHFTDVAQNVSQRASKSWRYKAIPKVDVRRQSPRRARWPASPAASHPHHAARGLGSQALRQPRLRAVVAASVLDAPSRHGCRGHPSSEGRVGALHARRDGVRAAASRASQRSRASPPRMRRCPSGRRPVERGGRDERLDGQGRVRGRKGRQGGGAHAADRPWRERQLAQS